MLIPLIIKKTYAVIVTDAGLMSQNTVHVFVVILSTHIQCKGAQIIKIFLLQKFI